MVDLGEANVLVWQDPQPGYDILGAQSAIPEFLKQFANMGLVDGTPSLSHECLQRN